MRTKRTAFIALLLVVLVTGTSISSIAQESGTNNTFGPQDVFGLFFRALASGDLVLFTDGSVVSSSIANTEFILEVEGEETSYEKSNLFAMAFSVAGGSFSTRLFVNGQGPIEGDLNSELTQAVAIAGDVSVDVRDISSVIFNTDIAQSRRDPNRRRDFGQVFPMFTRMMASMSVYDTVIMANDQLASVLLEDRDDISVTLNSPTFGVFNFPVADVAWVEFAQSEEESDSLVLQNGDRVSGVVTVDGTVQGTLASGSGEFSFSGDSLREEFKQIVFRIPLELFGGGGGGRGENVRPDDQDN